MVHFYTVKVKFMPWIIFLFIIFSKLTRTGPALTSGWGWLINPEIRTYARTRTRIATGQTLPFSTPWSGLWTR